MTVKVSKIVYISKRFQHIYSDDLYESYTIKFWYGLLPLGRHANEIVKLKKEPFELLP